MNSESSAKGKALCLRNRQRQRPVDLRFLRRIIRHLLIGKLGLEAFELCIHLVPDREMACLNERYLRHFGSTDVITFDHAEEVWHLWGEIFICVQDAVTQARRFHTTWQSELIRYVIHGVLHLQGFDDRDARSRRVMKRRENALLRELAILFHLDELERSSRQVRTR